jgi:phospholipid/cholesterol/gamma-HCH transport system substrate-binding protein
MSGSIAEGAIIESLQPIETDEMLRTLNTTNNNIAIITRNLEQITGKLNRNNSLWSLLGDSVIASELKFTVQDIRMAGRKTAYFTSQAQELIIDLRQGEGLAGALLTDTLWKKQLNLSFQELEASSQKLTQVLQNMNHLIDNVYHGQGISGNIISDTILRDKMINTLTNVEEGSARFNQNMEALKHNFLLRRYFKRKEKQKIKEN